MHDFNGGILPSGLFWTVPAPGHALRLSRDGRRAVLTIRDVPVVDTFQFGGPNAIPATVSMHVEWRATSARASAVRARQWRRPTPGPSWAGSPARSTGRFSGSEFGFRFRSNPGVSTERGFAELGRERNGVFL